MDKQTAQNKSNRGFPILLLPNRNDNFCLPNSWNRPSTSGFSLILFKSFTEIHNYNWQNNPRGPNDNPSEEPSGDESNIPEWGPPKAVFKSSYLRDVNERTNDNVWTRNLSPISITTWCGEQRNDRNWENKTRPLMLRYNRCLERPCHHTLLTDGAIYVSIAFRV